MQGNEAPSASANAVSTTAEFPTLIHSIPDEPVQAQERVKRPAEAISGPRDGHCVERTDATGICSLASGRSHFFTCSAGGAPPKSLPDCKSAGGSTTWCCF